MDDDQVNEGCEIIPGGILSLNPLCGDIGQSSPCSESEIQLEVTLGNVVCQMSDTQGRDGTWKSMEDCSLFGSCRATAY